jgi:hypothetical protein
VPKNEVGESLEAGSMELLHRLLWEALRDSADGAAFMIDPFVEGQTTFIEGLVDLRAAAAAFLESARTSGLA